MLIELLIVMVVFGILLGATLALFNGFERGTRDNERFNQQIETARNTSDTLSRQLRNLAKPTSGAASTINFADKYDLIFQTSDPTRTWVRYCLDTTGAGASADNGKLWTAESSNATLPAGATGPCPGTGWAAGATRVVATNVVNRTSAQDRPIFAYGCTAGASASCSATPVAADYPRITSVATNLFVDLNVARRPVAEQVTTSVFLRNQNEAPTASFTTLGINPGKVFLNGSGSTDPEGRTLRYFWFAGAAPVFTCDVGPPAGASYLPGVTATYPSSGTAPSGSVSSITLVVCDPGDLQSTDTETVTFP